MKDIYWLREIDESDAILVGRKATFLAGLLRQKLPLLDGFVISTDAYFSFFKENALSTKLTHLLHTINLDQPESLQQVSAHCQRLITSSDQSLHFADDIVKSYQRLSGINDAVLRLTIEITGRSSGLPVETPTIVYSKLIKGDANLLIAIKKIWSMLFEEASLTSYAGNFNELFQKGICILVQKIDNYDVSGVALTVDPVTGDTNTIIVETVQGMMHHSKTLPITPDHIEITKKTLTLKKILLHPQTVLYRVAGTEFKETLITKQMSKEQKMNTAVILTLAELCRTLEKESFTPLRVTFGYTGTTLVITSLSPLELRAHSPLSVVPPMQLPLLTTGIPASPGIATGTIKFIKSSHDLQSISSTDILVIRSEIPEHFGSLKKAAGVIMQHGGKSSKEAHVARSLGIPSVVGTINAPSHLTHGQVVTLNGSTGEIFKGGLRVHTNQEVTPIPNTQHMATKVGWYLDSDQELKKHVADQLSSVSIFSAEALIKKIGIHPKKIIHDKKRKMYIEELASHIARVCQNLSPRTVIYRLSDLDTQDYRRLMDGREFESSEQNPLLGYHGALRAVADPEMLMMELEAIKLVRNTMSQKNLSLLVPFVRSPRELLQIKKNITRTGLYRSPSFRLWLSIEIPSNIFSLEKLIACGIDGICIRSDRLSSLMLAMDYTNPDISHHLAQSDESILEAHRIILSAAHNHSLATMAYSGSHHLQSDLVEKLVQWGVGTLCVRPDELHQIRKNVANTESKLLS